VAAPPAEAEVTPSGLASLVLSPGDGSSNPRSVDKVTVDYTGWTTDGKMFDSSITRGKKATFPLNAVIAGWTEGVALMSPGEKRRFWIPEEMAYKGMPGRPAGMLVFDVELFSIEKSLVPDVPEDVAAPPANADFTASGLASVVIEAGTGSEKPGPTTTVKVDYTGWTADGQMFDSSVARGEPISFGLNRVIKGWQEGVQLMVEGETRRLWIPANLAYGDSPPGGAPGGQLCFDVKLIAIEKGGFKLPGFGG
jgi:FKBP-type peptidyl-prolyl cis-trans isomerase